MHEISIPDEAVLSSDFPHGQNLDILMEVRETLRKAAEEKGYEFNGCGVGVGGENCDGKADLGLSVHGRRVEIRIYLPRGKQ
jgi:hypothetical protein